MIINRAISRTACALVVTQGPNKVFQMVVASRSRLNFISRSVGSCYEMTSSSELREARVILHLCSKETSQSRPL